MDPDKDTPAVSRFDGVDYSPARNWLVLFGHHFSSISGAGPIIGPVIACIVWGWLPALLWIIAGSIFIGGMHDFGSLMCSVRKDGNSIADIASSVISHKAKIVFSIFLWMALILVIAVFTYLCADTFVKNPNIVLPSLGLIPVAVGVGLLLYKAKFNNFLATAFGIACLIGLIFLGEKFPVNAGFAVWIYILLFYCFFASVIPVQALLQPRDYLSSFLLLFGIAAGYLGLLMKNPHISHPAYLGFKPGYGFMWPMMFVTVACGAVSGFHSLISSGTTSKQLSNERFARRIGYGAMITEGLVALMAVLVVCAGLKGRNLGLMLKDLGPINSFSEGYGEITRGILGGYGGYIAVIILNAFILTTLDSATRITRYLTEEFLSIKNRYLATLIVIIFSGLLALSGAWQKIWPVFGASNQLVAALTLLVISCWLFAAKKPCKKAALPAAFMFMTAVAALVLQAKKYLILKDYLLFGVCAGLLLLAFYLLIEAFRVLTGGKGGKISALKC